MITSPDGRLTQSSLNPIGVNWNRGIFKKDGQTIPETICIFYRTTKRAFRKYMLFIQKVSDVCNDRRRKRLPDFENSVGRSPFDLIFYGK